MQGVALQPEGDLRSPRRYNGALGCVRQILRQEGLGGLYRGLSTSYLGTVETVVYLVVYEKFKQLYQQMFAGVNRRDSTAWDAFPAIHLASD